MALTDLTTDDMSDYEKGEAESPFATPTSAGPPPDEDELGEESDKLYAQSFGKGTFSKNQYGGLTFNPADEKATASPDTATKSSSMASSPAAIDPDTMRPLQQSFRGRQQIRNLQQLAAVAKALKNVPEEFKNRILSHLMGIPYQGAQQKSDDIMRREMMLARYRSQLGDPQRQAQLQHQQAGLDLRAKSLADRESDMADKLKAAKANFGLRFQNAKSMRELHQLNGLSTVMRAIDQMTKAAQVADEPTKLKMMDHVAKLHKLAAKYEDMLEPDDQGEGEGNGSDTGQSATTGRGESY